MFAVQVFWKHCEKRRKCSLKSNFSFTHCVFYPFRDLSGIFIKFENCCLQTLSVSKRLKFVVWERVKSRVYLWKLFHDQWWITLFSKGATPFNWEIIGYRAESLLKISISFSTRSKLCDEKYLFLIDYSLPLYRKMWIDLEIWEMSWMVMIRISWWMDNP